MELLQEIQSHFKLPSSKDNLKRYQDILFLTQVCFLHLCFFTVTYNCLAFCRWPILTCAIDCTIYSDADSVSGKSDHCLKHTSINFTKILAVHCIGTFTYNSLVLREGDASVVYESGNRTLSTFTKRTYSGKSVSSAPCFLSSAIFSLFFDTFLHQTIHSFIRQSIHHSIGLSLPLAVRPSISTSDFWSLPHIIDPFLEPLIHSEL